MIDMFLGILLVYKLEDRYMQKYIDESGRDPKRFAIRIYNEKGERITNPDLEKGYLTWGPGEQNEYGEWVMNQFYRLYTEEELKQKQIEKEKAALDESRRQMSLEEVTVFFMRSQLNTVDIPDQSSLRMMDYYPTFEEVIGQKVKMGFKFTYKDKMYKTIQPDLTIQTQYPPEQGTESLYSRIDIEHTGAVYDPIPYDGNLELIEGKYYTQTDVLYLCIRNSGQALTHALKDLVGVYVEVVKPSGSTDPEIQEWKQPTGAQDAYKKGDRVMYNGKKYESIIDNNVYAPDAYPQGWKEIV